MINLRARIALLAIPTLVLAFAAPGCASESSDSISGQAATASDSQGDGKASGADAGGGGKAPGADAGGGGKAPGADAGGGGKAPGADAGSVPSATSTTQLVSDIDDTIKRTDVLDKVAAAVNALKTTDDFSGMELLYVQWHDESTSSKKITYLSAAPGPVIELSKRFLQGSNFPGDTPNIADSVIGGRTLSQTSGDFKTQKLYEMYDAQVAAGTVPHTYILIGDNGEQDMIAYGNFIDYVAGKGGSTDRIYSFIHHAYDSPKGSEIVAPHRPFVTAADLAVQMNGLALIGEDALVAVLHKVAVDAVDSSDTVIPSFMSCQQYVAWPQLSAPAGAGDYKTVQDAVTRLCNGG